MSQLRERERLRVLHLRVVGVLDQPLGGFTRIRGATTHSEPFPTSRRGVTKDENGLDDRCDAVGAAAELSQEAPALQGGHGLLAEAADLGVRAVVPALPPLEATAAEGYPDGAAGALAWIMMHRRLARDYETLTASSEGRIHIASIDNLTKHITDKTTLTW